MNGNIYFEIQADETQRAAEFYEKVFDWKITKDEQMLMEYWRIETGSANGGLLKRPAQAPTGAFGTNAFVCSFQVDDFDKTAKIIIQSQGKVAFPKFVIPGKCWQGYFIDTEGNTFGIYQTMTS